jgi:hypothetical protein
MATMASALEHEHSLKVGKKGEITLTQPTKIGDTVLQPDTYVVQHRISGDDHFVRFLELKQVQTETGSGHGGAVVTYSYTVENNAGEIKCRVEPLGTKAKATTVSFSGDRITKITIKGEDVVHGF